MQWKVRVIVYREVNATLDGKPVKATMSDPEYARARRGAEAFATTVASYSDGGATVKLDWVDAKSVLTKVEKSGKGLPWASAKCVRSELNRITWGTVDSVLVVWPGPGVNEGWGLFYPDEASGCSYGCIPASMNLEEANGEWYLHEWLHGVCTFFRYNGYPQPAGDADGAGALGYTQRETKIPPSPEKPLGETWKWWDSYYIPLMQGKVNGKLGIPKEAWLAGTPSNPGKLVGRKTANPAAFQSAYPQIAPAIPTNPGSAYLDGHTQDFISASGKCVILQGKGRKAFGTPADMYASLMRNGEVKGLGFPTSDVHRWGKGYIQDFETTDGWHSGVMREDGTKDVFVVRGAIWRHYVKVAGNGATSYLGYPTSDEITWHNGKENLIVQRFRGGWIWYLPRAPYNTGDRPWGKGTFQLQGFTIVGEPVAARR